MDILSRAFVIDSQTAQTKPCHDWLSNATEASGKIQQEVTK
jgi:hypothetical protein